MTYEEVAAEFGAMDEQEQEVALHEARRIAVDPTPYRDLPLVIVRALRIVLAELDRKAELADIDSDESYAQGFSDGRATTYPKDERRARLNELCRAQGFVAVHMREPHKAAKRIAHRISQLSKAGQEERP